MITELAKMGTGLMVRGGVGMILRMSAFAAMSWAVWRAVLWAGVPFAEWASANYLDPLIGVAALVPVVGVIIVLVFATDPRRDKGGPGYATPWGLSDFLRRVPFACWCLITDDGDSVPVWAILVWPAVAVSEVVLCAGTLVALPCIGLWWVACLIARAVWRVLSFKPLDRR